MAQRAVSPFMSAIFRILSPLEKILIVVVLVGTAFRYLHLTGAAEILLLSMMALAAVFYLLGFKPMPPVEGAGTGMGAMVAGTLLPKLGWIGCSVTIVGLLFTTLHLNGGGEMLMVGSSALGVVCVLSFYFMATGSAFTPNLMTILYRAIPLCVIGWYMLMNLTPVGPMNGNS